MEDQDCVPYEHPLVVMLLAKLNVLLGCGKTYLVNDEALFMNDQ